MSGASSATARSEPIARRCGSEVMPPILPIPGPARHRKPLLTFVPGGSPHVMPRLSQVDLGPDTTTGRTAAGGDVGPEKPRNFRRGPLGFRSLGRDRGLITRNPDRSDGPLVRMNAAPREVGRDGWVSAMFLKVIDKSTTGSIPCHRRLSITVNAIHRDPLLRSSCRTTGHPP